MQQIRSATVRPAGASVPQAAGDPRFESVFGFGTPPPSAHLHPWIQKT
jgi:hypothetical protein